MKISGKVALVTGASSGIGAAVAVELARRGARVAAVARREDRLAEVVARCADAGGKAVALPADVSTRPACEDAAAAAEEQLGPVDILVNNAGISVHKPAAETTVEEIERLMAVNFLGPVWLTKAVLPAMLARRSGSIVNVTSVAGYVPNAGEAAYGASKAALSRWTHGLVVDLHGTGVSAGVLSPGPIDTEIWSLEDNDYKGKLYPPEVVAKGVARLIESGAAHMTVPRRYGMPALIYPLVGRPMRWGIRRYEARS
ncbi:MAG: SDR family NAD(P)-dependent oxidoreductase [Acidimicrobiales bacterium]